jgi:hypothetical protein
MPPPQRNVDRRTPSIQEQALHEALSRIADVRDEARRDDGRVERFTERRMHAWRYFIRRLITEQPFVLNIQLGIITAVDIINKTCTVVVDDNPSTLEDVKYYPPTRIPRINTKHTIYSDVKVPTRTMPENTVVEHVEHWLKQFGGDWLYSKRPGSTDLRRYPWPPPAVDETWEVEIVNDEILEPVRLFGSATDIEGGTSTELVFEEVRAGAVSSAPEGWVDLGLGSDEVIGTRYHHYADVGTGEIVRAYNVAPPYVYELTSIANDGLNTTAWNEFWIQVIGRSSEHLSTVWTQGEEQCFGSGNCDGQSETWSQETPEFSVIPAVDYTENKVGGGHVWAGELGNVAEIHESTSSWGIFEHGNSEPHSDSTNYREPGGGCECVLIGVAWTLRFINPLHIMEWPRPIYNLGNSYIQLGTYTLGGGGPARSWNYDGVPASAQAFYTIVFIWNEITEENVTPDPIQVPESDECHIFAQGCIPGGVVTLPRLDGIAPDGVFLALDSDRKLIVWAAGLSNRYHRWTADSQQWTTPSADFISGITAISRDGERILAWLGEDDDYAQVYSEDGGDTWERCAPVPVPEDIFEGNLQFVDEVA